MRSGQPQWAVSVDPFVMHQTATPRYSVGQPLRVAHLLLMGGVDGVGLHVRDLAAAQLKSGTVQPVVVTCPTHGYARLLGEAAVPLARLPSGRLLTSFARGRFASLLPQDVDLVHLHGYRASQWLFLESLLGGHLGPPPRVVTCHGFVGDTLRRRVRRWTELRSYRYAHLVITTNQEQMEAVRATAGRVPISYVPNGIDPAPGSVGPRDAVLARFAIPPSADVIGSIGRLSSEKRHDLLLAAAGMLVDRHPGVHVLILGEGRERSRLEALARRLAIADRVRFAGLVPDVPQVCAAFSVLVHSADTEGTPRAVLEAMAAGVPTVCTAVGGVPDLVDDGVSGLLTVPGSARALAAATSWVLDNPARAVLMGKSGRRRVLQCFTTDTKAARIEALYRSILLRR
jgi:L-malate glycosyltransferase